MDVGFFEQLVCFLFDQTKQPLDFFAVALEIVERKDPDRNDRDLEFHAPTQHFFELVCTVCMTIDYAPKTGVSGVSAISIQDDADVARQLPRLRLPLQALRVSRIKGLFE